MGLRLGRCAMPMRLNGSPRWRYLFRLFAVWLRMDVPLFDRGWLLPLRLLTVVVSILVHGVSARPLMKWYVRRRSVAP